MSEVVPLRARSGEVTLAGSLWRPDIAAVALLVMHPGSGPSNRDNDDYFPPIRAALLARGCTVASFDKRGVGESDGSWLEAGIAEQADDLLAGVEVAIAQLPNLPVGIFGHSQGGWVVLEAAGRGGEHGLDFAISCSGPAVSMGAQERFATHRALQRLNVPEPDANRVDAMTDAMFALAERGARHDELLAWAADPAHVDDVALVTRTFGDDLPPAPVWDLVVRLAAFDPARALRAVDVPLLAVFGGEDEITPVDESVDALRSHVASDLLEVVVLAGGGHRLATKDSAEFVDGFPGVVVDYVSRQVASRS
jgi:pimeloyl-ACP methyl ester carboxylesterase